MCQYTSSLYLEQVLTFQRHIMRIIILIHELQKLENYKNVTYVYRIISASNWSTLIKGYNLLRYEKL